MANWKHKIDIKTPMNTYTEDPSDLPRVTKLVAAEFMKVHAQMPDGAWETLAENITEAGNTMDVEEVDFALQDAYYQADSDMVWMGL